MILSTFMLYTEWLGMTVLSSCKAANRSKRPSGAGWGGAGRANARLYIASASALSTSSLLVGARQCSLRSVAVTAPSLLLPTFLLVWVFSSQGSGAAAPTLCSTPSVTAQLFLVLSRQVMILRSCCSAAAKASFTAFSSTPSRPSSQAATRRRPWIRDTSGRVDSRAQNWTDFSSGASTAGKGTSGAQFATCKSLQHSDFSTATNLNLLEAMLKTSSVGFWLSLYFSLFQPGPRGWHEIYYERETCPIAQTSTEREAQECLSSVAQASPVEGRVQCSQASGTCSAPSKVQLSRSLLPAIPFYTCFSRFTWHPTARRNWLCKWTDSWVRSFLAAASNSSFEHLFRNQA